MISSSSGDAAPADTTETGALAWLGWIILGSLVPISYKGRTAAEPEKYKKAGIFWPT
jgi:hypothetical protein